MNQSRTTTTPPTPKALGQDSLSQTTKLFRGSVITTPGSSQNRNPIKNYTFSPLLSYHESYIQQWNWCPNHSITSTWGRFWKPLVRVAWKANHQSQFKCYESIKSWYYHLQYHGIMHLHLKRSWFSNFTHTQECKKFLLRGSRMPGYPGKPGSLVLPKK